MSMNKTARKSLEQVVEEFGRYPLEAFEFVRLGLSHTVLQIHGDPDGKKEGSCHVTGQQLCWGLRNYAVLRYGVMAQAVLTHWGVCRTSDFGKIVFAMIDAKLMQRNDEDDIRDFDNVFEFDVAFRPPARPPLRSSEVFSL